MKCAQCTVGKCEHDGRCTIMVVQPGHDWEGHTFYERCDCDDEEPLHYNCLDRSFDSYVGMGML